MSARRRLLARDGHGKTGHIRADQGAGPLEPAQQHAGGHVLDTGNVDLKSILASLEQAYIVAALQASGGAIAASAKRLGLQRTTLIEKMRRLQISAQGTA